MARDYLKKIGIALAVIVVMSSLGNAGSLYLDPVYPGEIYANLNDTVSYNLMYDASVDEAFFLVGYDFDFGFDNQELEFLSASSPVLAIDDLISGATDPGALWFVAMDVAGGYEFMPETPETILSIDFRVIGIGMLDGQSDCWVMEQDPLLFKGMMDDLGGMHSFGASYGADVVVPEPGAMALVVVGGLAAIIRRKS